ncbi:RNA-directed DNA polymerase reverse transcriptase [Abeliophyllum distichum]|uniref:RNA-directed DNA polymerase reverse transcriptase n=1 Tax=Abeliophyllum distichum TaxID=126358 RepID=A0ABD1V7J3_9LAMI
MAYIHRSDTLVSHLCFVDDMIIFVNGQKHSSLSHTWTYPCLRGTRKTFLYDDLLQKVKNRISRWAFRLLSSGGRITLLRSVLSSLPLYLLQIMQPPETVLKKLESTFARFLWDSKDQAHRMHWRRWKDICLPTDKGGLGFRRLEDVVQAFSLKLWWLFRSQHSLWAQFLLGKYCRSTHPILAPIRHFASVVWKEAEGGGTHSGALHCLTVGSAVYILLARLLDG